MALVTLVLLIAVFNICLGFVLGIYVHGLRQSLLYESDDGDHYAAQSTRQVAEELLSRASALEQASGAGRHEQVDQPSVSCEGNAFAGSEAPEDQSAAPATWSGDDPQPPIEIGGAFVDRIAALQDNLAPADREELSDLIAQARALLVDWVGEIEKSVPHLLGEIRRDSADADAAQQLEQALHEWAAQGETSLSNLSMMDSISDVATAGQRLRDELTRLNEAYASFAAQCKIARSTLPQGG